MVVLVVTWFMRGFELGGAKEQPPRYMSGLTRLAFALRSVDRYAVIVVPLTYSFESR